MNDPMNLSIGLANVDSTLPLLPDGDYTFQVKESAVVPNKDKNGWNWKMKLGLCSPATSTDGREVKVDFPIFVTLALQAKEDSADPEAFKRGLAESIDAIFGTSKENRPDLTNSLVSEALGKFVVSHVVIDEYEGKKNNKSRRLKAVKPE